MVSGILKLTSKKETVSKVSWEITAFCHSTRNNGSRRSSKDHLEEPGGPLVWWQARMGPVHGADKRVEVVFCTTKG